MHCRGKSGETVWREPRASPTPMPLACTPGLVTKGISLKRRRHQKERRRDSLPKATAVGSRTERQSGWFTWPGSTLVNERRLRRGPARRFWLSFLAAAIHLTFSLSVNFLFCLCIVNRVANAGCGPGGRLPQQPGACWANVPEERPLVVRPSVLRSQEAIAHCCFPMPPGNSQSRILLKLQYMKQFAKKVKYCPLLPLRTGRKVSTLK